MITIFGSSVSIFTTNGSAGGADPLVRGRPPGRLLLAFGAACAITEGRPGGRPRTRRSAPPDDTGTFAIEAGFRGTVRMTANRAAAKAATHGHTLSLRRSIFASTPDRTALNSA